LGLFGVVSGLLLVSIIVKPSAG